MVIRRIKCLIQVHEQAAECFVGGREKLLAVADSQGECISQRRAVQDPVIFSGGGMIHQGAYRETAAAEFHGKPQLGGQGGIAGVRFLILVCQLGRELLKRRDHLLDQVGFPITGGVVNGRKVIEADKAL